MAKQYPFTEEQKKFIDEKYGTMSDKHIAIKLRVPRHAIRKYLKLLVPAQPEIELQEEISPLKRLYTPTIAKIVAALVFSMILVIAADLRSHTFSLPHFRGDEHHYAGLAFKLDTQGIKGYNLSGINLYGIKSYPNLVQIGPAQDKGQILKDLAAAGITYYDEPLHHIPFGFPMAIMISHKMFAFDQPYFLLAIPNDAELINSAPPGIGLRDFRFDPAIAEKQFYIIIVPLVFSFLLISFTYFLAKKLYGSEIIALTAMFLMTISPVDLLTSQKVWADDMTAALTLIAAFLYIMAVDKNKPILALAAGISCGLSAITKQSGAFVAFAIVLWHFAANFDKLFKKETFLKTVFDKNLISFGLGAVLAAGYWFAKVTSVYGTPAYKPYQPDLHKAATDWFAITAHRPKTLYLLGMPYQNPLFALAYFAPFMFAIGKKEYKNTLFLIIWGTVFLYIFSVYMGSGGKEERYMLPSYPAFAILGAYVADNLRRYLDRTLRYGSGTVLLIITLFISALWSIPMAFETLFTGGALIMKPF